jgi:uncharacterized protein (UPF0212 family)
MYTRMYIKILGPKKHMQSIVNLIFNFHLYIDSKKTHAYRVAKEHIYFTLKTNPRSSGVVG